MNGTHLMKNMNEVRIEIPSRIHITLLAMDMPTYRTNGGIGFAVDLWNHHLVARRSKSIKILDERQSSPLNKNEIKRICAVIENAKTKYRIRHGVHIRITQGAQRHIGLGTGTAILLGSLEAYLLLSSIPITPEDLIILSGRGGTSGIGVHTYFQGGFILDGGHPYTGQKHMPSRLNEFKKEKALLISRIDMPNWKFGIFVPNKSKSLSGEDESEFFKKTCPVSHCDAALATYHAVFGTFCSVMEGNIVNFSRSINEIQYTKWKSEEIKVRGEGFLHLYEKLKMKSTMLGLSSLGPLMYFMSDDLEALIGSIKQEFEEGQYAIAKVNNCGRKIDIV